MRLAHRAFRNAVVEVRFKATGRFVSALGKILDMLQASTSVVISFGNHQIHIGSDDAPIEGHMEWKRAWIKMPVPDNLGQFRHEVLKLFSPELWSLFLEKSGRIGFRVVTLAETNSFETAFKLCSGLGLSSSLGGAIGYKPVDIGAAVVYELPGSSRLQVAVGPMTEQELQEHFKWPPQKAKMSSAVIVDADYFAPDGIEMRDFPAFVEQGAKAIEEVSSSVLDVMERVNVR